MSDGKPHEIVIIKRGGHGDHDEHHGGVWKIAFADFMTAMMAFFLVMWLISANDKTRASVARYFNPVRLVDATTQPRGLHDTKKDESGITATPDDAKKADDKPGKPESTSKDGKEAKEKDSKEKTAQEKGRETPAAREKRLDTTLRENPYVALAEIAATRTPGEGPAPVAPPTPAVGRRGGETFRDPFAPPPMPAMPASGPAGDEEDALPPVAEARAAVVTAEEPKARAVAAEPKPAEGRPDGRGRGKPDDAGAAGAAGAKTAPGQAAEIKAAQIKAAESSAAQARTAQAKTAADAAEAKAMLAALQPGGGAADGQSADGGPQVDVHRTSEGLLVSLTDTAGFAMFANGSAVPNRRVVLMMERVGRLMKDRPGEVVVRGFTDARPYRTKGGGGDRYDNWHLSLDRAQVIHYMLVRGGLADARIGHVEGYADRGTRPGVDPTSPLNRRIEVLLKDPA